MKSLLGRLFYKVAYKIIFIYWFFRRPQTQGVQLILRNEDKIFFIDHAYMHHGKWDFPGGGMKANENPLETAKREAEEELQIDLENMEKIGEVEIYHSYHHDHIHVFEAKLTTLQMNLNYSEIKKSRWFPVEELPTNLHPFTDKVLKFYLNSIK